MKGVDPDHIVAHGVSAVAIIGGVFDWVPKIAVLVGMVWYLLQIWETRTVQEWINRLRVARPPTE